MYLHIQIDDDTQRRLIELQVRLSSKSKRLTQTEALHKVIEIVHALPNIHSCSQCGKPMAGIGVCSEKCYKEWTGSEYGK